MDWYSGLMVFLLNIGGVICDPLSPPGDAAFCPGRTFHSLRLAGIFFRQPEERHSGKAAEDRSLTRCNPHAVVA